MTTRHQGAALATIVLKEGVILVNDEVTAGPYRTATDPLRYAIFVDKPSQHWLPKGRHVFGSPEEVAWHLVERFGVSGVRRMVDVAYRRAGLTPPATPPKAAKRGRGRKRNGGDDGRRGAAPRQIDSERAQSAYHGAVARGDWAAAAAAAHAINAAAVEDRNPAKAAAWRRLHRIASANATRKPNGSGALAGFEADGGPAQLRTALEDAAGEAQLFLIGAPPGPKRAAVLALLADLSGRGGVPDLVFVDVSSIRGRSIFGALREAHGGAERGLVLTGLESHVVRPPRGGAPHVTEELHSLNFFRDVLDDVVRGPLVLVVDDDTYAVAARSMPDLMSFRMFTRFV